MLFLTAVVSRGFAQEQQVQGIVFDKDTKQRITRVYIYNTRTHKGYYNNTKGEFTFPAQRGDTLVAALQGYAIDTTTVKAQTTLLVYLKRTSILLKEIGIKDTLESPAERLARNKEDYGSTLKKGDPGNLLNVGGNGGIGAGLSIDALWSLFSREGKNARFLQKIIERDYREAMIDYRYTRMLVAKTTGLKTPKLEDFMQQYRPAYYFIVEANDYALINFIRQSYQSYLRNPAAYRLPALTPVKK
ncbi:hypothetical protein GS398_05675 [Pedobacter sp. HMF7056]|uniref:Carboxypeptidase-like regulatory domain-containing protein n=1 Tax=Hufsiella ginkgonis TaxID=2695274 RepID=A0A7K1XVF1_9SPHI|nr:hypothetical protein [Hufsiella ginkgonis]